MKMIIPQNAAEAKKAVLIEKYNIGSAFLVVGTIVNPILIEVPSVEVPNNNVSREFEANDANWQQATSGTTAWQLDADNIGLIIDGALGWVRLNKPAGDNVGVNHKW